ncbi:hypothetical protein [Paenibacillus contaminans]|uniref:hypothetical protein n=1 Tax=Paenibacillus contaminans TaxID=450362 RepID=UPI00192D74D9|nr:hypothetical protein [Paenibacillus contaminans]
MLYGELEIRSLNLPFIQGRQATEITIGSVPVSFSLQDGLIAFQPNIRIKAGQSVSVTFGS